jgi:hypothetical protein
VDLVDGVDSLQSFIRATLQLPAIVRRLPGGCQAAARRLPRDGWFIRGCSFFLCTFA